MLESPPVSPKTVRHGKRSRQSSKGSVSLGEISQEDTGYDGDVEVVRPDEVEELESEDEHDGSGVGLRSLLWPDTVTDEDLAARMKKLGWRSKEKEDRSSRSLERPGAKRLSRDADPSHLNQHGKRTEIEISELLDSHHKTSYAKRTKESKFNMAKRIIRGRNEMQTDTSEQTDGKDDKTSTVDEHLASTPPEADGTEEMDLD